VKEPTEEDRATARTGRMVALVIAGDDAVVDVGGQWMGGQMGWDPSYAYLVRSGGDCRAVLVARRDLARLWARQKRAGK
jgi:hypothetical protein